MLEWLNGIDTQFFLWLNGCNSAFFDHFFTLFTAKEIWYPLYVLLLVLFFQKYKLQGIWVMLFFILAIVASDQLSGLIKILVARPRPTHNVDLMNLVNAPAGKGGMYGFVSSHAANSFALAFLLGFLMKRKRIWIAFLLWAFLMAYSRIYVGVHYPFDVLVGALLGAFIAWGIYKLLMLFDHYFQQKRISMAEHWKLKHTNPVLIALIFITITIIMVAIVLP